MPSWLFTIASLPCRRHRLHLERTHAPAPHFDGDCGGGGGEGLVIDAPRCMPPSVGRFGDKLLPISSPPCHAILLYCSSPGLNCFCALLVKVRSRRTTNQKA
jgi:hypothetical protein